MSTYCIALIDIQDKLAEMNEEISKLKNLVNPIGDELSLFLSVELKLTDTIRQLHTLNSLLPMDRANMELS